MTARERPVKFGSFLSLTVPHLFPSLCPCPSLSAKTIPLCTFTELYYGFCKSQPLPNLFFQETIFSKKQKKTHRPWLPLLSLGVCYETESLFHLPFQQGVYILWNIHGACIYIYEFIFILKRLSDNSNLDHNRDCIPGKFPSPQFELGQGRQDATERLHFHFALSCSGEGNGNPLQCSCMENPRDGGAWWAAVHRVAQSRARLKQLSSSRQELRLTE